MLFSTVAIAAFASLAAAVPVKRGFSGKATYYATGKWELNRDFSFWTILTDPSFDSSGLGACGQVNVDSDYIVALNSPMFGSGYPGPNCFKQIRINANGKSAVATIMDQCPGCAYGSLDLSPDLFSHFADHSVGVFNMDWDFIDGSSAPAPVIVSLDFAARVETIAHPLSLHFRRNPRPHLPPHPLLPRPGLHLRPPTSLPPLRKLRLPPGLLLQLPRLPRPRSSLPPRHPAAASGPLPQALRSLHRRLHRLSLPRRPLLSQPSPPRPLLPRLRLLRSPRSPSTWPAVTSLSCVKPSLRWASSSLSVPRSPTEPKSLCPTPPPPSPLLEVPGCVNLAFHVATTFVS